MQPIIFRDRIDAANKLAEKLKVKVYLDKENLNLVKVFLKAGIQIRHVKNMPPMNFRVSDKEMAATIEKMEGGKMSQSFLISNEPLYINHFNSLFDNIWNNGIDAKGRIKAIEEGADFEGIEIIQDPVEIQKLGFGLVQTAGGKKNYPERKGATFAFSLPLHNQNF